MFGPRLTSEYGVFRDGDYLYGMLPLFADGKGHEGSSLFSSVTTTLYRNGKKVGSNDDPLFGDKEFKVPSGDAAYKLTTSVKRSAKVAAVSTRIDASWTFRSKKTAERKHLPVSTARFQAVTGLDGKVKAGKKATFPVTVEGAAKGKNLKSLSVYVSYDHGKTWKKTTVKKGRSPSRTPRRGRRSPCAPRSPTRRATRRRSRSTTRTTASRPRVNGRPAGRFPSGGPSPLMAPWRPLRTASRPRPNCPAAAAPPPTGCPARRSR
ncbi:hypothetical protein SHKM778_12480 [Streptomyces sp. KM77-8]|uniref:Exo-alpha-sialidase n=1 Tax=Streptomyces haneummycinicus TaxID=3074435 RepID=A0AAT9HBV0_9ACTN